MAISKITNYILKIIFWSINWLILAIYGIFSLFQRSISGKQIFILMCIVSVLHGIIFLYNVVKFSYYSAQGIIVMQRSGEPDDTITEQIVYYGHQNIYSGLRLNINLLALLCLHLLLMKI